MDLSLAVHQDLLRSGLFLLLFLLIAGLEYWLPRRAQVCPRKTRWPVNLGLLFTNIVAIKLVLPFTLAGVSLIAQHHQIGLFNLFMLPRMIEMLVSLLLFDLLIYVQHLLSHQIRLFWRIHRVHHTDLEVDITTGVRFHPLEIILSMLVKSAGLLLLGVDIVTILLYEVLLNGLSLFTHSNIDLPKRMDHWIRLIIVTPDMHRIHHSVCPDETDSNYGNLLSCWDRLFGTYLGQARQGQLSMQLGLPDHRDPRAQGYRALLHLPIR